MASGIFIFDIIATLALSGLLLFSYGDWFRQRIFVTISVLLAWYFSFLIIFVLPLDISSTTYRQCLADVNKTGLSSTSTNTIIHEQDVQHITENEIIKHKVRNSNASSVSKVLQDQLHLQVRKIWLELKLVSQRVMHQICYWLKCPFYNYFQSFFFAKYMKIFHKISSSESHFKVLHGSVS